MNSRHEAYAEQYTRQLKRTQQLKHASNDGDTYRFTTVLSNYRSKYPVVAAMMQVNLDGGRDAESERREAIINLCETLDREEENTTNSAT